MTDTVASADASIARLGAHRPTRSERRAAGAAVRDRLPHEAHAESSGDERGRDPVAVIEAQGRTRLPDLLALRHGRMAASPFAFYRGAAAIMADDLRAVPDTGIETQLCGDAHLSNVGLFASPERSLLIDLNDFDETAVGPFEWDVKRMAASFELAGRARGFAPEQRARIISRLLTSYAEAIDVASRTPVLEMATARLDADAMIARVRGELRPEVAERVVKGIAKTRQRDSADAVARLADQVGGTYRFRTNAPTLVPLRDLAEHTGIDQATGIDRVEAMLHGYRSSLTEAHARILDRFRVVDVALKVVGVGSVGTRAWVVLLTGNGKRDVLVLQAKEAQRSVLEPPDRPSAYAHQGERVVHGQRRLQAFGDVLLGHTHVVGIDGKERDFYVRQFRDWKGSAEPERMERSTMKLYAEYCGIVLARAHARGGDAATISGYLGDGRAFARALVQFAAAYADRTERDHTALLDAIAGGRLPAVAP
ncbi:DUF2252 domain-containing protein [Agromyces larvae]|uniref:DUF2252 domain-containing protein n=1 Tax=Agromyces larvae TaxID=2929802 RepID=A0ABY4BVJ6_9MICO|nr:DUF2252 domain-containing protein [Agromyces larvae]UOE43242.1 DUF2252 domain-containing protein [Agromyces larvae]